MIYNTNNNLYYHYTFKKKLIIYNQLYIINQMYNDNKYNYHGNYDKNIKAIRGGGVITPSNPPNRKSTTGTVNNTWNSKLEVIPPLFESVYYSDKILTNGYLNSNNYVVESDYISDYYYPSQNFDKVNLLNDKKKKNLKKKKKINDSNPLNFPPPLITSKHKQKNKDNIRLLKKNNKVKKIKLSPDLDNIDY